MATITIREAARRSGLSEPTLRYYEDVGLIGPIERDESSGHRRYESDDVEILRGLACLRSVGVSIEEMRTYQANRSRGRDAAAEQRDLLLGYADRLEAEIARQQARLKYLKAKASMWNARAENDSAAEKAAIQLMTDAYWEMGNTE